MTAILGSLGIIGVVGVVVLALGAPARRGDAADLRAAIVDHRDDLAWCGAGERRGSLVATVVVDQGAPTHVGIAEADVPASVAHCVADTLVAASWPRITAAARVPLRFE